MSVKRSRAETSSSQLAMPVKKIDFTDSPPSRSKISAFASPTSFEVSDQLKIGGFLERCNYCNKRIDQNCEVFMYSNLCAFCSAECRDSQIALDQWAEKQPENTQEKLVQGKGFYNETVQSGI